MWQHIPKHILCRQVRLYSAKLAGKEALGFFHNSRCTALGTLMLDEKIDNGLPGHYTYITAFPHIRCNIWIQEDSFCRNRDKVLIEAALRPGFRIGNRTWHLGSNFYRMQCITGPCKYDFSGRNAYKSICPCPSSVTVCDHLYLIYDTYIHVDNDWEKNSALIFLH